MRKHFNDWKQTIVVICAIIMAVPVISTIVTKAVAINSAPETILRLQTGQEQLLYGQDRLEERQTNIVAEIKALRDENNCFHLSFSNKQSILIDNQKKVIDWIKHQSNSADGDFSPISLVDLPANLNTGI